MPVTSLKFNCVLFPGSQSNHNLDESIFSVSLPRTKIVDDLKDAIKAKRAPWFDQLAACELMLYKVSIPTNNNNLATVLEGLPFGSPDNRVQKLSSLSSLSTEFQGGVAVGHLHIVVKRPATSRVYRSQFSIASNVETEISTLYDLIWRQHITPFKSKMYTVPSLLEEDNVTPITIDNPSNDSQAMAVDREEPHSKTWKMDRIDLNEPFLPFNCSKILVRGIYPEIYDQIKGNCVILGQPGIGKTYCLTYILARRLWERKSTTYQKDKNTVLWFSEGGALSLPAARLPSKALGKDTWHLFDSNEDLYGMPSNLANARGWLIQASPPERDRYKRWVKEEDADMIWMEPVPWHEMYIMGDEFSAELENKKDLARVFLKYGPDARTCLRAAGNKKFEQASDADIQRAVEQLPQNFN